MYLDSVLFIAGAILLITFLFLAVTIRRFWNRWQEDEQTVQESNTERVDVVETISKKISGDETGYSWADAAVHSTEKLGGWSAARPGEVLDTSVLNGKYTLLREIHEGNMSRVFLAQGAKMGNPCVVKFIANDDAELADEAEILKKLNHLSLPQVLDILRSSQGLFLVERQVEGYSLSETIQHMNGELTRHQVCDWAIQLSQVLQYLHSLDTPIYHCDLKPSNIMITHDNRLVLVDFGIARRRGLGGDVNYATYAYAAPELLAGTEKGAEYLRKRFGELPSDSNGWGIDERTDLYSVGVILYELFTGTLPQRGTEKDIYRYSTKELGDIICKCMSVEPKYRYRNAKELSSALEKVQNHWNTAPHRLQMRRAAMFVCWLALAGSMGSTASAAYIRQVENTAQVNLSPGHVTVSPHQSITLTAENIYPDGIARNVDLSQMDWSYSEDNIAQIDGGRLMGLQKGTVTVTGKHRSTTAVVEVEVTEPVENGVEVSLQYVEGASISRYAGGSGRDMEDGRIENSLFVSPQSLYTDEQTLWLTDSGSIRTIQNGIVSTINGLPSYLRAKLVRHSNSVLYFLSEDWEEDDGTYRYGIAAYHGVDDIDMLYETESGFTVIHDMAVSSDGKIWFIQENFVEDMTRLYTLDASQRVTFIADLPAGATNLCFDENDGLYISVPGEGMIYRMEKSGKEIAPFLGGKDERNFIDGPIPNFYRPTSMICIDQFLYVLDFDTVRRITILEDSTFTETVVGIPVADTNPQVLLGDGNQAVLCADNTASLCSSEDGSILLSDSKNSTIYQITIDDTAQNMSVV